ncbi:hypothetical protein NKG94_01800 [Micromonospora sp. M12]
MTSTISLDGFDCVLGGLDGWPADQDSAARLPYRCRRPTRPLAGAHRRSA